MWFFFTNGYISLKFENFAVLSKNIRYYFDNKNFKLAWKTCKTHTYSISVKQSVVSIILYNGFSNNETDINDFLCKIFIAAKTGY
jgi:hypothetical protein